MTTPWIFRAVLPYDTNIPKDVVVNSFSMEYLGSDLPTDIPAAIDAVIDLYNTASGGGREKLAEYLSECVTRAVDGCRVEVYNLSLSTGLLGQPVAVVPFQLEDITNAVGPLPDEVALCVSLRHDVAYQGAPVPRGRKRGRIYFGPFDGKTLDSDGNGRPIPNATFREKVLGQLDDFSQNMRDASFNWSIWSRTDEVFRGVDRAIIDDAWDTQRRRGQAPLTRIDVAIDSLVGGP